MSDIERIVLQRAKDKANVARWGLSIAIYLFAVMIIINVLTYQGIDAFIVAGVAVLGLTTVWLIGWRRGAHLFQHFYTEELSSLQQSLQSKADEVVPELTPREIEVLQLVSRGYSNKKIAFELKISEYTVKSHLNSVMAKLKANDRTEAAVIAIRHGIIDLSLPIS